MKKIYTSPSAEVHTINAIQMIANSIDKDSQGITNPDDYDFLGREDSHDSKSHNIWDKEWKPQWNTSTPKQLCNST